eukprot:5307221-Pyramimonas_sp.AAC.1
MRGPAEPAGSDAPDGAAVPDPPAPIWGCDLADSAGAACNFALVTRGALLARQRVSSAGGRDRQR